MSFEAVDKGARLPSWLHSRESQVAEGHHPDAGSGLRNEQHLLLQAIDGLRKTAEAALERAQAAEADARKHQAAAEAAERSKAAELQRLREAGRLAAALFEDGQREREPQRGVQRSFEARIADSVAAEVRAAVRAVSEEATVELRAAAEELRRLRMGIMNRNDDIEGSTMTVPPLRRSLTGNTGNALTTAGSPKGPGVRGRRYSLGSHSLSYCASNPTLSSCSKIGSGTFSPMLQKEVPPRPIAETDDVSSSPRGSRGDHSPKRQLSGQLSCEAMVPYPYESGDGVSITETRSTITMSPMNELGMSPMSSARSPMNSGRDSRTTSPSQGRRETIIPNGRSPVLRLRSCVENRAKRCHSVPGGEMELSRSTSGNTGDFSTPATPAQVRARARLHGSDAWWVAGRSSDVVGG